MEKPIMDFAHTSMLVREFLAKNKNVIMPQPPYSQDLAAAGKRTNPKTEDNDERKAFCNDCGDKRNIETAAVGDIKKRVPEMF